MNVYHSAEYQASREKYAFLFQEKYRVRHPLGESTQAFDGGYTVRTVRYERKEPGAYWLHGSRHWLRDKTGKIICTWDNINDSGDFSAMISHSSGKHYLVFREDLYGYSVLEAETGREVHYMPEESFPLEEEKGRETFIWTGAAYDPRSNLLAVSGCYWACPNGTLMLDFSDPLAEQDCSRWLDLHDVVDPDYEMYDGIDWEAFGPDGILLFRAESAVDGRRMDFTLPAEQISAQMKK